MSEPWSQPVLFPDSYLLLHLSAWDAQYQILLVSSHFCPWFSLFSCSVICLLIMWTFTQALWSRKWTIKEILHFFVFWKSAYYREQPSHIWLGQDLKMPPLFACDKARHRSSTFPFFASAVLCPLWCWFSSFFIFVPISLSSVCTLGAGV